MKTIFMIGILRVLVLLVGWEFGEIMQQHDAMLLRFYPSLPFGIVSTKCGFIRRELEYIMSKDFYLPGYLSRK